MAFSCTVYALDAAAKRRLKMAGVAVPMTAPSGRNPRPAELNEVLGTFGDFEADLSSGRLSHPFWHADVWHSVRPALHPWCFISVDQYSGDDVERPFRFERGSPEFMLEIVQALSAKLGPLVVRPDGPQPPVVVQTEFDPTLFLESWRDIQPPPVKRLPRRQMRPGEVDLNEGMIEATLNPDPGFVSKHRFVNWDVESRLARIEWFADCGNECSVDLSVDVVQAKNWEDAIKECSSSTWTNATAEARNQLTVFLHTNDHDNYQNWNRFTHDRKLALNPILKAQIEPFQTKYWLPDDFLHSVSWDLLGAMMEEMYAESGFQGHFFHELLMVYEAGHFPCGWHGEWPQGKLIVY